MIGGLITSTMLRLVVIPVAYTYFDDVGSWLEGKLVSREREREIDAERPRPDRPRSRRWGD